MTAIRVVRQGKKGKTDRLPLYVEFYINREKIRIAVRLSVTSKEWDEQNEVIKGRDKESKDKNLIISNIRSRVSDIFVRARLKNETLTKKKVSSASITILPILVLSLILHGFTSNKLAKQFLSVPGNITFLSSRNWKHSPPALYFQRLPMNFSCLSLHIFAK